MWVPAPKTVSIFMGPGASEELDRRCEFCSDPLGLLDLHVHFIMGHEVIIN